MNVRTITPSSPSRPTAPRAAIDVGAHEHALSAPALAPGRVYRMCCNPFCERGAFVIDVARSVTGPIACSDDCLRVFQMLQRRHGDALRTAFPIYRYSVQVPCTACHCTMQRLSSVPVGIIPPALCPSCRQAGGK